jgi:hypothetical protein
MVKPPPGLRTQLSTSGSFLSVSSAYASAGEAVRNAVKLEVLPVYSASAPGEAEMVFFTDRVLIDLAAVDPEGIDAARLAVDCDLLKRAVMQSPGALRRILAGLQSGTPEGIRDAAKAATELGLTEEDAVKAGGGLIFLIVVAVAAVAGAGCVKKGTQMRPGNQATTPGHGTGGGIDGGGGNGGGSD